MMVILHVGKFLRGKLSINGGGNFKNKFSTGITFSWGFLQRSFLGENCLLEEFSPR